MAKKKEKMTDDDLASMCAREFEDAQKNNTDIVDDRIAALDGYNQEKYGNEEEGLSGYVSSDIHDTVEWIMPQLVEMFVGGDAPVKFDGVNAEDVKAADIETAYTRYSFLQQNKGVILTTVWFKDALLQKNGIVKVYWDEPVRVEREEYKGKSGQDYLALQQDPEFTVDELTIILNEREFSEKEYMQIVGALLPEDAARVEESAEYHIIGHRRKTVGQPRVENVPPENFFIQRRHNSIDVNTSDYCGEWQEVTRSELVEMGYDRDLVDSLPSGGIAEMTDERWARNRRENTMPSDSVSSGDSSREIVTIVDHYIRADFNNDGIAELRHVRTVGKSCEYILENDEVDRNIYHAITPTLNNYRFFGRSVADILVSLQRAKSQLWRNIFDNAMYSSMPRKIVSGNVDMQGLLTYVAGGIIRKDVDATIENETTPFVAGDIFPILDRMDSIRSERTGFSKDTMGLNPEALANSTNVVGMSIMAQSQLLVKMIATIFAHSGFQSMMEHLREIILKYEKEDKIFDLTGEFLETDPRSWRKQRSSTVKVGIGFSGKNEEITSIERLLSMQKDLVVAQGGQINGPLTNAAGIYNSVAKLAKRLGFADVKSYFQDPAEYQPPAPTPTIAEVTLKANIENMNKQNKIKQTDQTLQRVDKKLDHEFKMAELEQKERLAVEEIDSRERIAELELLYKYGKDAKDRAAGEYNAAATHARDVIRQGAKPKPDRKAKK